MRTAPFFGRNPTVRFVLAAILLIVLVASGIVLVGYTTRVGGRPTPAGPAIGAAPSASPSPSATPSPTPSAAPVPPAVAAPPPPAAAPVPQPSAGSGKGSESTPKGSQSEGKVPSMPSVPAMPGEHNWPDNLPDPKEYENGRHGPSPFAERCRTGQIPAYLCEGFPKG